MSQIVRSSLPNNILIELLDKVCHKNNNYYIFNNESYKKGNFTICLIYLLKHKTILLQFKTILFRSQY